MFNCDNNISYFVMLKSSKLGKVGAVNLRFYNRSKHNGCRVMEILETTLPA